MSPPVRRLLSTIFFEVLEGSFLDSAEPISGSPNRVIDPLLREVSQCPALLVFLLRNIFVDWSEVVTFQVLTLLPKITLFSI